MRRIIRKAKVIWKELDDFRTFRPKAGIMEYLEHLFAWKGDRIRDYNILYPYIIIVYYLRTRLKRKAL